MTFTASPSSLWIIKPGSLGDIVHTLPCAAAIRNHWSDTQITWAVDARWAPLLEGNPVIDKKILFHRQDFRGLTGVLSAFRWMLSLKNEENPDICLDLQGLFRSALMARFSRAKRIVGFSDARESAHLLYHQREPGPSKNIHAVDRYLSILPALGIRRPAKLEFPLPPGSAPQALLPSSDWVLLHPFARGEGKSLSEAAVLRFCERFRLLPIVIAGMGKISLPLPPHCSVLLNRTSLNEMIWLCRHARFTVSVDSGPVHIAAAASDSRVLSLHTWSDPRKIGPYSTESWIWQGGEIRRQKISPDAPLLPPRQLEPSDMDQIASWLHSQFVVGGSEKLVVPNS